ncbi:MAG: DoxX subfamily [Acidobacteriota bacterium]|nr:DoxX subfamily [Acidobacteriota bacterium]
MSGETPRHLSSVQGVALIALRTLIGWHFLYEGYYKLALPAWSPAGTPLAPWTSSGYLKSASGPLAGLFQRMLDAGWTPWIDNAVKISLLLIGLSLMLGLFTKVGSWAALLLLLLFYVLSIPMTGTTQPGNEGTYLIVNKTLVEAAAVGVLLAFNTGAIAGLDLLLMNRTQRRALKSSREAALQTPATSRVESYESKA